MDAFLKTSDKDKQDVNILKGRLDDLVRSLQPGMPDPTTEQRRALVASLLALLVNPLAPTSPATLLNPTLGAIKILGRSAAGSEELGREKGLSALIQYGGLGRVYAAYLLPASTSTATQEVGDAPEQDPLALSESEALRCLSNVLMLHPSARDLFPTVMDSHRDALGGLVRLLTVEGAGFLAGRLLFLLTSKQSDLIVDLAERSDVVKQLVIFADRYLLLLQSPNGPLNPTTDILREHLKFSYNLMLQYGRQPASSVPPVPPIPSSVESTPGLGLGHHHDDDEEDTFSDDGSSSRPESPNPNVLSGSLPDKNPGIGGGNGKKKRFWSSPSGSPNPGESAGNGGSTRRSKSPLSKSPKLLAQRLRSAVTKSPKPDQAAPPLQSEATEAGELPMAGAERFLPLFQPLLKLAVLLPIGEPKEPSALLRGALNALLNFPIRLEELDGFDHSWLQEVPGHDLTYLMLPHLPQNVTNY